MMHYIHAQKCTCTRTCIYAITHSTQPVRNRAAKGNGNVTRKVYGPCVPVSEGCCHYVRKNIVGKLHDALYTNRNVYVYAHRREKVFTTSVTLGEGSPSKYRGPTDRIQHLSSICAICLKNILEVSLRERIRVLLAGCLGDVT